MAEWTLERIEKEITYLKGERTLQPVGDNQIRSWLSRYGFELRPGKGSHAVFHHPKYPDVFLDINENRETIRAIDNTIVLGSTNPRYKNYVLSACIRFLEIKKNELEATQAPVLDTTPPIIPTLPEEIAKNYEFYRDEFTGEYFLRHKTYKFSGIKLGKNLSKIDDFTIHHKLAFNSLEQIMIYYFSALQNHDFEEQICDDGTIILMNKTFPDQNIVLDPLTSATEENNKSLAVQIDEINSQIAKQAQKNSDQIDLAIQLYGLEETEWFETQRVFRHTNQFTGKQTLIKLDVSQNGFTSLPNTIKFLSDASDSSWGDVQKNIDDYFGFESKRKRDDYVFRHRLYDISFTIAANLIDGFPIISNPSEFYSLSKQEQDDYVKKFAQWGTRRLDSIPSFREAQSEALVIAKPYDEAIAQIIFDNNLSNNLLQRRYETNQLDFKIGSHIVSCHGLYIRNLEGNDYKFITTKGNIAAFEEQVKLAIAKLAKKPSPNFSQPTGSLPGLPTPSVDFSGAGEPKANRAARRAAKAAKKGKPKREP